MRRLGKPGVKGEPKIPRCFDPLYRLSEKLHCPGLLDASRFLNEESRGALRDVDSNPRSLQPELQSTEVDNRRKAMGYGMLLREPCHPRTALARLGGRV